MYKTAVYTLVNGVITHKKQQMPKKVINHYTSKTANAKKGDIAQQYIDTRQHATYITFLIFAVFDV